MLDPKTGDRIMFLAHGEPDPAPLTPGEKGTVTRVGPWQSFPVSGVRGQHRTISVAWDSGRSLMLIDPVDSYQVIIEEVE